MAGAPASRDWRRFLGFRCTGCGNCCRGTVVMVTDADLRRIAEGTGLPLDRIVRFVPEDEANIPARSSWWVRFGDGRAVMALRHRAGGACAFLDAEDRCTIYDHRPVTCREHPFNVTLTDSGAVEHLSISRIVDCPHDWDGHLTRGDLRSVVRWNERQSEAYLDRVRAWNRRRTAPQTRPGFLRFLGFDA